MKGQPAISSVYNRAPSNDLEGQAAKERNMEVSRRMWKERGFVMVDPAWLTSWEDQELLKGIARKLHGKGLNDG